MKFILSLLLWGSIVDGVLGGAIPTQSSSSGARKLKSRKPINDVATSPGQLRGVQENTGVCETTPGVYQASGYGDISADKSIWFWHFAARNNPSTAPFALWLNGGPGSSSMVGLLREHGPCRINNDTKTVSLNPYSWNNEVNMLYIDQPIGTGFSYGTMDVGTSQEAAADVWSFLQIFFQDSRFKAYQANGLAVWTESYGGHYAPVLANYILSQNAAIAAGTVSGVKLNLQTLGIGDGLLAPMIQYPSYITYATANSYQPLVSKSTLNTGVSAWNSSGGCESQISACYNGGSDATCKAAQLYCHSNLLSTLNGPYDLYYVASRSPDPYPPDVTDYMTSITATIGGAVEWEQDSQAVANDFINTGDPIRTYVSDLETVINSGVRTILYNGDADYISNYIGVEAVVDSLNTQFSATYQQQSWSNYTVSGQVTGQYKNAGTFSYIRVYGAGHEVPAYKFGNLAYGQAAAQMFTQIMKNESLSSTGGSPSKSAAWTRANKMNAAIYLAIPTMYVAYLLYL